MFCVKVDFVKAYDFVKLSFLNYLLVRFDFDGSWRG